MNSTVNLKIKHILTMMMLILFSQYGKSQCSILGNAIQVSEFGCANDIGKICLFTTADNLSSNMTWTAELEYPTGSFVYTDLGDFALGSTTSGGNEILTGMIALVSDGAIALCLEGTEQVAGTIYTMRIVSNTGIVAFERTFSISSKLIDGTAQPVYASEAITDLALLPVSSSSNGQHIRIEGKLIFDVDYDFGWSDNVLSEIIMGENASIEIESGKRVVMDRVLVRGCDDKRWDNILLQSKAELQVCLSTFRDARKAIVLKTLGNFTSLASLYENNLVSIESIGTQNNKNNASIQLIGNNWFPNVIRQGNIGLNLDYFMPQTIAGSGLKFENLNEGIHAYHGGLTITSPSVNSSGVSFSNCHSAVNSRNNSLLAVYGAEMYSCYSGFTDAYSHEEIIKRSYILNTKMPFVKYAAENSHTLISDNKTVSSHIDLYGFILPSSAEIENNRFNATWNNIWLYGYGSENQKWSIQSNPEIAGFENSANVVLNNMHNARIFRNASMYAEGTSANYANIKINGGANNKIGYNNLDVGYDGHGIIVNGSTKDLFYCNHVNGSSAASSALEVKGECIGTEIRGNDDSGSGFYNLTYGNANSAYANTGNQPFKGNIFASSASSSPKAVFYGNSSLAQINKYQVSPINNQGNAYFPYNTAPISNWFNAQTWGEDYTCPPGKPGYLNPEKQLSDLFSLRELVDNSIAGSYHPEIEWGAKLKLYEILSEYKTNFNSLPPSLENKLTSMQGDIFSKFYAFDKRYLQSVEENQTDAATNKELSDDVLRITEELNTIDWYRIDTITGSLKLINEQLVNYNTLKSELNDILFKLNNIQTTTHHNKLSALTSLQEINNSINPDESVSANNLKTVNSIWIKMSLNDASLTEVDVEQLKAIANQCATLGGDGVFRARSLLASIPHDEFERPGEYNDDCLPTSLGSNWNQNSSTTTKNVVLSPNPAMDQVYIVTDKSFDSEAIKVRNKLGEYIQDININPESNSQTFDVSNWSEGIYYLQVNTGGPMYKLTVVRP